MDFTFDLSVPANTLADAPERQVVDIGAGVIHLVEIEMAQGCKGEVYAAVMQGLHQVWPSNDEGAYHSNGRVYSTREHYLFKKGDAPLLILGWSPGTSYAHNVQFRFSVLPVDIMEPWRVQERLLDTLLRVLGIKSAKGKG